MLVFGAGASWDSIAVLSESERDNSYRPPLTDGLFAPALLGRYLVGRGGAKGLVANVAPKLAGDRAESLEALLTKEYEFAAGRPNLARGFTALRFYLRDLFNDATTMWPRQAGGATNYQWLVRQVEEWRGDVGGYVLWVTFNYDGLLDQALEDVYRHDFGFGGPGDLPAYITREDWCLIKLHGSYDWRRRTHLELRAEQPANDETLSYVTIEEHWDPTGDQPNAGTVYRRDFAAAPLADSDRLLWVPALMAPLASKSTFECPPAHLRHLVDRLTDVDLIYTVGWRAQEEHFLDLLRGVRANRPDVYSLTGRGATTADAVARRIGDACGGVGFGALSLSDVRTGFSAVARDADSFPFFLAELIEKAVSRRGSTR
jgi:hypothetical protein